MNSPKPMDLRTVTARLGEDSRLARGSGCIPLTPALSLGERVKGSPPGAQSTSVGFPLRLARCSLSSGERVRVRGNPVNTRRFTWVKPGASREIAS